MAGIDPSRTGTFGFFESENDPVIAGALLGAAQDWLAARGAVSFLGPMNFSLNHECGLLIEGFDSPPFMLMGHNPPWYKGLIEGEGYTKAKDLYAWRYVPGRIPDAMHRVAERTRRSPGLRIRRLDRSRFDQDARTVLRLFNSAWRGNWGFTPMLEEEFDQAIRDLRRIVNPDMVVIAEKDGRPVGMAVSLPNLNESLRGLRGRLLPFGFLKLLWRLKVRKPRTARCLMLGIEESERRFATLGLSALIYEEMDAAGPRNGVDWGELSWTLEDNEAINRGVEALGAVRYKTYRIYEKRLDQGTDPVPRETG